mmetsp:Transcript_5317/g.12065  ORF Transcript_5317/g.12065 Transcript_5317/m.12065 type:complete len:409 (-) Transcript_5317:320-1546(-)|eukprot:CAMPEP_0172315156 /NCGR_PEP_ID=MMETSP1058-20130122/24252_1 /TAXON_ID=83371 /ORGANISM="Detonula confervacea, Strain CCMP 353" /LENGTH=408 /DNA_ID=CAMNT_0013029177 /DNA_START=86 /DNA_END=1312 /DNA_ORIENTATION=+
MATSTRRLLHRNVRAAHTSSETDDFREEPHSLDANRRQQQPSPPSTTVLDALSDEDSEYSELARFLLVGKRHDAGWFECFRRSGDDGDDSTNGKIRSMGKCNSDAYSLALEPIEIRSERIIMLAEAYAIFGGLFLGGTWILYEWGSPIAHGGAGTAEEEVYDRIFLAVMAITICCNIFLALWSSILWILAIVYSSRENFVFEARKLIAFCNTLMWVTYSFITYGCFLAVYLNLRLHWPELIVVLASAAIFQWNGVRLVSELHLAVSPLSAYHQPLWLQALSYPLAVCTSNRRETLQERAKAEANQLKTKAYRERNTADHSSDTSIGALLRSAAANLGRVEDDLSLYEARLEQDWFNEAEQLKDRSVECLSQYMPLRLAEEVYNLVEVEYLGHGVKMKSIYVSERPRDR